MEVTIRTVNGVREPKSEDLLRIMQQGSPRARLLKLADRISNLTALGYVHDAAFVRRYVDETRRYVLPYAKPVNADMFLELSDLVASREQSLTPGHIDAPGRLDWYRSYFPIATTWPSVRMKIRPPAIAGDASARSPMSFRATIRGPAVESTTVSPVSLTK